MRPKVHCRVHKTFQLVPALNQTNAVHVRVTYVLRGHLILSSHAVKFLPCRIARARFLNEMLNFSAVPCMQRAFLVLVSLIGLSECIFKIYGRQTFER
jgi:hypothetical protein